MRIIQLIPGAGTTFYCENCLRDNSLARALREMNHEVLIVPLYLPILTDESNGYIEAPVFFGGINVYLQQKSALFRKTPRWIDRIFDSPLLLNWVAKKAEMTRAQDLADTTLSMLSGELGFQVKELDRLINWLTMIDKPDVVYISNALLLGMAKKIKQQLKIPIICNLQDEDIFIDELPEPQCSLVWKTLSERTIDVDVFVAVSNYYKNTMSKRLQISEDRIFTIYNGFNLDGFEPINELPDPPAIGYLERLCPEKGLHLLTEAFIILKSRKRVPGLKLRIAGGKTADDEKYIKAIRKRISQYGLNSDVDFLPILSREDKLNFLRSITVFSVPAIHEEAFGGYILEAMASGVPVVQPSHGAFPELLEITGGGSLFEPNSAHALAMGLEKLLLSPDRVLETGKKARKIVCERFNANRMAEDFTQLLDKLIVKGDKIQSTLL